MNEFFGKVIVCLLIFIFLSLIISILVFLSPFLNLIARGIGAILAITAGVGSLVVAYIAVRNACLDFKKHKFSEVFFGILLGGWLSLILGGIFYECYLNLP